MPEVATKGKLLVIEDEAPIARLLKTYLTAAGYDVHTETRGSAALAWLEHERPDLVILDLRLPDMNGLEICRVLRKRFHSWSLPIVMLTGMDAPADQLRGYAHGADAYMTKPFEPPALLPTLEVLMGKPDREAAQWEKESP